MSLERPINHPWLYWSDFQTMKRLGLANSSIRNWDTNHCQTIARQYYQPVRFEIQTSIPWI